MLKKGKDFLLVLPSRYDTACITEARVDCYSTVSVDTNHYSVPDHLVGEFVLVKAYPDKVLCYHNQVKIASHQRCLGQARWSLNISHYLNTLKLKPKAIYRGCYQRQERQFIDLLELVSAYSLPKVSQAIAMLEKYQLL